jgi:UDP-glucose 4-epimerase
MKLLLLGSEGFIGHHLMLLFKEKKFEVAGCDLYESSLHDYRYFKVSRISPGWEEIFSLHKFDICINAAGSGNVPHSMTHPLSDFEANTLDTIRILDAIRTYNPSCKYLHISSAAVYGNPEALPVKEDQSKTPLSPYGWHKLLAEQLCREFTEIYNISTAIVRPFSVYGPGLRKQLFWDIYQKYLTGNDNVELWGTGAESRDFIYVEDLARAFDCILQNAPMKGETYNIATGTETSIKEAVETFLAFFDKPCVAKFNQRVREGDPMNWRADISKISNLGFQPGISLIDGLRITSQWLKSL